MKNLLVQKYGGTSVGSIDKIKKIAQRIVNIKRSGKHIIVIVSAMGDTTDTLVDLAHQIHSNPPSREMDVLLATGEQISISLLAMAIELLGEKVISLTGPQVGLKTNSTHKRARITDLDDKRVINELKENKIVIVAGFQGIDANDDITTLGRGGSDTSAVAIAAGLNADKCEIYTDVDGVYTADPRIVKDAKKLDRISYDEVLEMASLGAGVLHPRSVELAEKFGIPLVVRSSFHNEDTGTIITTDERMERTEVKGIALDNNIGKISIMEVPDKPGIAYRLFSMLANRNIHLDMIVQNTNRAAVNDISFTVDDDVLQEALEVSQEFAFEVGAQKVEFDKGVAKLSIIGTGIVANPEISSQFFETLYNLGVNIHTISTSETKISVLVDKNLAKNAMISVHKAFGLDQ